MRVNRIAVGVVVSVALLSSPLVSSAAESPPAVAGPAESPPPPPCNFDKTWVTSPKLPVEIPGEDPDHSFCEFYQFAWQSFLYLVSPSSNEKDASRNFEVQAKFPLLQASDTDSCTATSNTPVLFVRTLKSDDPNQPFVVPEKIGQAGDGAVIYDKNGNVVYYQVRFSRNLCPPQAHRTGNLPDGTIEIKTAWRQLGKDEDRESFTSNYFTNTAIIQGEGASTEPVLLGLVGFHLFQTTSQHPEGVWMTWEHEANDPDCLTLTQPAPKGGWSFIRPWCARCLAHLTASSYPGCVRCLQEFNHAVEEIDLTGTPSQICRVYRNGSDPEDMNDPEKVTANNDAIDLLNKEARAFLSPPCESCQLDVFANYFMVGGLWVSDPNQASGSATSLTTNQRGSLQLASTVMETTVQGDFEDLNPPVERTPAQNCFSCHNYTPGRTATTGLSHIVDDIDAFAPTASSAAAGQATPEPVTVHEPSHGGQR